jgi:hypothetical protein
MPKRLAITIAGAVSLGSYEAGVLYEILRAVRFNNENTDVNAMAIFSAPGFEDFMRGARRFMRRRMYRCPRRRTMS